MHFASSLDAITPIPVVVEAGFSIKQRWRELRVEYESAVQGVLPYTSLLGKGGFRLAMPTMQLHKDLGDTLLADSVGLVL